MGHNIFVMAAQLRLWSQMYPLNHIICHFGPKLSPLKLGVGLSALALALSGLGWALYGLKVAPSCLIWAHLITRWPASEIKTGSGVGSTKPNFFAVVVEFGPLEMTATATRSREQNVRRHVVRRGLFFSCCRRRGGFIPAVGEPAAFAEGTAPALTARRRTPEKVIWPGVGIYLKIEMVFI